MEKFGERLKDLMIEKGVSNQDLATSIGVHITTVQSWKRNAQLLSLTRFLKLADRLECSLDFLAGRTDVILDFTPQPCLPFYPRFRKIMKDKGKTRYRMDKETKIKDSYFTEWNKGYDPHILSLVEIANYLDVSIDYLVGRDR